MLRLVILDLFFYPLKVNTIFEKIPTLQGLQIKKFPVIPLSRMNGLIGWLNSHETYNETIKRHRRNHGESYEFEVCECDTCFYMEFRLLG
jgi:phosphatidylinositol kinase/protein kinase (PI-3  family)